MFGFLRRKPPIEGDASPAAPAAAPATSTSLYPAEVLAPPAVEPLAAPQPVVEPSPDARPEVPAGAPKAPAAASEAAQAAPDAPIAAPEATAVASAAQAAAPETPAAREVPPLAAPGATPVSPSGAAAAAVAAGAFSEAMGPVPILAPLPERGSWMKRLRQGMTKTRGNLAGLFSNVRVDDALFEELESALLTSDAGVGTTDWLMTELQERVRRQRLGDAEQVRQALRGLLAELLAPLEAPVDIDRAEPLVIMIAGVNGAGKTTSIGKLAHHLRREGKSILLAAGDTFRAAAREQLAEWGARNDVEVIAQQGGDPAAVAFDAVTAGRARRTGVVMIDTAGRLPTQLHLMEELKKIRRVVAKAMDGAPHETLLVLDGNTGQNMLAQVKAFDDAIALSGLIITKLDGTAKGGALAALAFTRRERPIPVYFVGVGEGLEDLQAFSAEEFASALLD
ncbi:MAG: signal recognition particle-docking protein FtsY [Burkholderiaceae bacterium]|nr:signal recognition particle-docking protein FtsY [Burkholderiaceae bacterium]